MNDKKNAVIIGAGPAGLTAASELLRTQKFTVEVIEKDSKIGGLAKTVDYKGYKFDIGPHHYVTELKEIEQWWKDVVKDDFAKLKRFTRIYYNQHFFLYPLEPINALLGLNIFESVHCVCSYFRYKLFPKKVVSYEDWLTNRFGKRLFEIFFKSYTEKLWGISCDKISADWAAQRIKNFSLGKAIFFAFFGKVFKKYTPRTILSEFYYPVNGSGSLWNAVGSQITDSASGSFNMNEKVISIEHDGNNILSVLTKNSLDHENASQKLKRYTGDFFLSTMTLRDLILSMDPLPPTEIINSAKQLRCRALITVNLIVDKEHITPDHWLYIHEKSVGTIRIGNMNNFSMKLRPDKSHSSISLEYFTFLGDSLWQKTDAELLAQGKIEVDKIGLVKESLILDGMVVRVNDAYPIYEGDYKLRLDTIYQYLKGFKNLRLMGRNGMHQYNNMDTAMVSAMNAVKSILSQTKSEAKIVNMRTYKKRETLNQKSV